MVTAAMVKKLREKTGAGIMVAKKALTENGGDIDASIDWLRAKGMAAAAKKSGRATAEGLVVARVGEGEGVIVEVNSETDFVARNSDFVDFVEKVAEVALTVDDLDALNSARFGSSTVADALTEMIARLGENLVIRRMERISGSSIASYIHNSVRPGVGRIGVLVALDGSDNALGRQVAMHVAGMRPVSISEDDMPSDQVERERQVLASKAEDTGKPDFVVKKIIEGGLRKFFAESTLINQKFVLNPDVTVGAALRESGSEVTGFHRFEVGEGM